MEQIILALAKAWAETASLIPDVQERRENDYHKILTIYEKEISKPFWKRRSRVVDEYRDKLLRHVQAFNTKVSKKVAEK